MIVLVMVVLPVLLLILGIPIFLILLATAEVALLFFKLPTTVVHQVMFDSLNKFPAARGAVLHLHRRSDVARRHFGAHHALGHIACSARFRGSLPLTSLGLAAVFGAISGATTATVAAVGSITYPRMRKAGYSERFASALIMPECALDNLIPPSIAIHHLRHRDRDLRGALFAAGIVPGLLLGGLSALYIYYYSFAWDIRDVAELFAGRSFLPRERTACWSLGAIRDHFRRHLFRHLLADRGRRRVMHLRHHCHHVIYREVTLRELFDSAARTMYLTAHVFHDRAAAGMFGWLLTISGVARTASDFITGLHCAPWAILLMINVLLLFVGCFLDTGTALLVLSPLLLPIAKQIGVDPIHFGVIVVMNLTIGTFTPPFGLNIFVFQALFKTPSRVLFPGLIPFVALAIVA